MLSRVVGMVYAIASSRRQVLREFDKGVIYSPSARLERRWELRNLPGDTLSSIGINADLTS